MQSHERCSVVEVMGRNAGHLALYVGLAAGATSVLVPEKKLDFEHDVIDCIRGARLSGKTHYMIIVAEGAGSAIEIGKQIHETIGSLTRRVTILGHIQRGGTPTARDRVMATAWATTRSRFWLKAEQTDSSARSRAAWWTLTLRKALP